MFITKVRPNCSNVNHLRAFLKDPVVWHMVSSPPSIMLLPEKLIGLVEMGLCKLFIYFNLECSGVFVRKLLNILL